MAEKYLILKHQVFGEISDDEVLKQIPYRDKIPSYQIVDIKKEIIPMENVHQLDMTEFRIYQKNIIEQKVRPYLSENPGCKVLYFGSAPIPLALHLGYCFGSWKDVDVYMLQREKITWNWPNDSEEKELPISQSFVGEEFTGPIDVIYGVEATYAMQIEELKDVVDKPSKVIRISLDDLGKDRFRNQDQLKAFAYQFSLGLDSVVNYLPGAEKVHLFATVPVGLAFLMGTKINPIVSKPIVAYQFFASHTPKHQPVLILQDLGQPEENISEADQSYINDIKAELKHQLENKIASFSQSKSEEKEKYGSKTSWIQFILPKASYPDMERGYWTSLPDLANTILVSSTLSEKTDLAGDGFFISEQNEWQISDRFIFNIMNRLERNKDKVLRALRMFIFHEAVHIPQNLTNYTAANIGRFPRVLEEADYLADAWAMVHEYSYSKLYHSQETKNEKDFFKDMIDIATKTMWAFDDLDPNTDEMQVRRVNRYLMWYWNYLQIDDRSCTGIDNIVSILANKPLLEIRGLDIRAQAQRTIFRLSGFRSEELEMAYLQLSGKIRRASNAAGFQVNEVVNGFRERKGDKILNQLKSWFHQIRE